MANATILDNTFQTLGNLAFYDGWHPNYFYFNTLKSYSVPHKNGWNPDPATASVAAQAEADAIAKMHLGGRSQEEATQEMENRFLQITNLLTSAYNYEINNEMDYFKQKYEELSKLFTKEEITTIQPLAELFDMFKPATGTAYLSQSIKGIDYQKFITLINVLLQGVNNTKAVAKYEAKRIIDLDKTMQDVLHSRGAQAAGLKKRDKLDTIAQSEAAIRAEARLKKEWETEYVLNHRLTQKTKKLVKRRMKNQETGKMEMRTIEAEVYNVFGGATFDREVQETVDTVVARWATQVIKQVVNDQAMIKQMANYLQANYAKVHTFHELEDEIQQKIILAIQQYGMEHLENLLVNQVMRKIGKKGTKDIVNKIVENSKIFDTVTSYDISSSVLQNNKYGQKGKRLKAFQGITTTQQMWQNSSEQLYDAMSEFISILEKSNETHPLTEEQSTLKTVLSQSGAHYLQRHKDMDHLIKRLQKLQKEIDKKQKDYEKQLITLAEDEEGNTTNRLNTEGFMLDSDSEIQIDFIIVDGKVTVNMGQLNSALQSSADFNRFGFKEFNPQSLRTAIASLKRRASMRLQRELEYGIQIAINNKQFKLTPQQLFNRVKQGLQNLKISVTGPTLSEMAAGIQFRQSGGDLIIDWAGTANGKNDMVTITIRSNDVAKSIDLTGVNDILVKKITNVFAPKLEQARKEFLEEWNYEIEDTVKKNTFGHHKDKYSKISEAFIKKPKDISSWNEKLQIKYKKMYAAWEQYKKALQKAEVDDDKIESLRHHFLNTLADSFYISTTVKTFKTYQNNLGFVGGSLGANLDEQLSRIADIFQSAGLPIDDLEWLKFAIINCSPLSIMKETNKNLIEDYLGSLMAFALFDEGSAEGKIVNQFVNQIKNSKQVGSNQASILHLYRVNGIYVPGSYVLKKVLDSIQHEIIPQIEAVPHVVTQGAGITIINGASTSFIPNRPISKYLHNTDELDTNAWATTGTAIEDTVQLKILFLAGLLDIVNSINAEMSNIEFPA